MRGFFRGFDGQAGQAAAGRGVREHQPEGGARGALPRLCALHHHASGAAGRARRAEAGAPAHPLRHEPLAARPQRAVQEIRQGGRRRDGLVPSARRPGHLRRARAPRPGFRLALSAHRRAGQFRQYRRRRRRRLPLHRSAHDRRGAPPVGRHRRGRGRFPAQLRRHHRGAGRPAGRLPEPARQRLAGHRRRHGDIDPAAQRGRAVRRRPASDQAPQGDLRATARIRAGAGLPDRRHRRRHARGDRRELPHRARLVPGAGALAQGGYGARHLGGGRDRDSLRRAEVAPHREGGGAAARAEAAASRRHPRRIRRGRARRAGAALAQRRSDHPHGILVPADRAREPRLAQHERARRAARCRACSASPRPCANGSTIAATC